MSRRAWFAVLLIFSLLAALGCGRLFGTQIKSILDNPRDYENKEVTLHGTVVDVTNLMIYKSFVLDDGTGQIRVVTQRILPKKGNRVAVTGTVKEGLSIGDSSRVVLMEKEADSAPAR